MPNLPSQQPLEQLIEQAMRDRAPKLYQSLKEAGTLQTEIRDRATMAQEIEETERAASLDRYHAIRPRPSHQESLNLLTQGRDQAVAQALALATEFPAEDAEQDQERTI